MSITNAAFIDNLLDNWVNKEDGTIGTTFAAAITDTTVAATAVEKIKADLKKLYLVFHYPQYTDATPTPTEFNGLTPTEKDRVFNYVYNKDYTSTTGSTGPKVLLSKNGITKANMVTLKMLLDSIVAATTAEAIDILKKATTDAITLDPTLGGNNTLITKTGGKGKNKSSKRVKKHPRRRNKSSKSLI